MTRKFNLARYKELLELEKNDEITLTELFTELFKYGATIESQIFFDNKENYFSLIEEYLRGKLAGRDFRSQFRKMENKDEETAYIIQQDFQKLETFTFADQLEDFSNSMVEISRLCLEYDIVEPMSESKFYSLVNKHYFQLAKLFPTVSTNNLPYEKLIYRSFKNLAGIIALGILLIFIIFLT